MAKKNCNKKWNRRHEFKRKKSNKKGVGHPVYVYGASKSSYKYLTFTHEPEKDFENDYEELKHNIDPLDSNKSYVKKKYGVSRQSAFRSPDKKYRIHPDDVHTVNKYKK